MHGYEPDTNLLPKDNRTHLGWAQMKLETMFQQHKNEKFWGTDGKMKWWWHFCKRQKANIDRMYFLYSLVERSQKFAAVWLPKNGVMGYGRYLYYTTVDRSW